MSSLPSVSTYTTASSIQARTTQEQRTKSYAGGNKAVYLITGSQPAGITTYQNIMPIKAPCNYSIIITTNMLSSTGTAHCAINVQRIQIQQLTSGAVILVGGPNDVLNTALGGALPIGSLRPTLTKTVGSDTLDLTVNASTLLVPVNFIIEIEVFNISNF